MLRDTTAAEQGHSGKAVAVPLLRDIMAAGITAKVIVFPHDGTPALSRATIASLLRPPGIGAAIPDTG